MSLMSILISDLMLQICILCRLLIVLCYILKIGILGSGNEFMIELYLHYLIASITTMATLPDKFLENCLHALICNFRPPSWLKAPFYHPKRLLMRKKEVHSELRLALHCITTLVPLAPVRMKFLIEKLMPRVTEDKYIMITYVEGLLGLERNEIGKFLGSTVLAKVNIPWEDILQEEQNKSVFVIELGDCNPDDEHSPIKQNGVLKCNAFADKLDCLMVVVCEHLKSCADSGCLLEGGDFSRCNEDATISNAWFGHGVHHDR